MSVNGKTYKIKLLNNYGKLMNLKSDNVAQSLEAPHMTIHADVCEFTQGSGFDTIC